jgi:archaea-specific RecJ-like exonuclease
MKKKFDNNKKFDNKKKFNNSGKSELDEVLITNISKAHLRKSVVVQGLVDKVVQTGGPTIFEVSDGSGIMPLKAFISAGERAYETINAGDYVKAVISIEEFNGEIEGDIQKFFKKDGEAKDKLEAEITRRLRKRATVKQDNFLVKSDILDKLKSSFVKAATEIRLAVLQARPIIVRHHNDTDGYCSGFSLERAILPLIEKEHKNPKAAWEYFTRAPCAAPYYELTDSIKDTANSLRNVAKFSNKMPLIIIADNGSTQEDLMGVMQAKIHGADIIVIDHHPFEKDVISENVLVHINPFLVGESGSCMSAGMLCAEISRFINEDVDNIKQIPALAGFADRIDLGNPGVMDDYMKIAESEGYSKSLLHDLSLVVEYTSAKVRFMEVREYIEVLFGEPRSQQKKLVDLMAPYIKNLDSKGLQMAKEHAVIEKIGKTSVQKIFIEETFPGFGFFPKPGRAVGLVHDSLKKEGHKALVSVGIMNTAMTFRATDEANFSVHGLIEYLNKELPNAFVDGGGHKNAGSINFLPKSKDKVIELFNKFVKG